MTDNLASIEAEVSGLDKQLSDFRAATARVEGDKRLTPEAQQAEALKLAKAIDEALPPARTTVQARIEAELAAVDEAEDSLIERALVQPNSVEEWQLAGARAPFIREDLTEMANSQPAYIVRQFARAIKQGDKVTAYLLARYAPQALTEAGQFQEFNALQRAIDTAQAIDENKAAQFKAARRRLAEMRQTVSGFRSPSEAREVGARLGVKLDV